MMTYDVFFRLVREKTKFHRRKDLSFVPRKGQSLQLVLSRGDSENVTAKFVVDNVHYDEDQDYHLVTISAADSETIRDEDFETELWNKIAV